MRTSSGLGTGGLTVASFFIGILSMFEAMWSLEHARYVWVAYSLTISMVALLVLVAVRASAD